MLKWVHITLAVISVAILSSLLISLLRRWCCLRRPEPSTPVNEANLSRSNSFQVRIAKLHQTSLIHQLDTSDIKRRGSINNYYVFRGGGGGGGSFPAKPGLFSWTDHLALVTDAVENGWSRFGFAVQSPPPQSSPPMPSTSGGGAARSALLGFCTTAAGGGGGGSGREYPDVEIGWEVTNASADFMQTIRFNRALRDKIINTSIAPFSVLRAALPLPGPQLGNSAFPQEAYFEITVLGIILRRDGDGGCGGGSGDDVALSEGEKTKLFNNEEPKLVRRRECDGEREEDVLCVGLTAGASATAVAGDTRLPGSFAGSIGFHSNGSIYLDGIKLVFESEKHEWGKVNKVIGCGYDPRKKKVYFTVDSHLAHVINCKAEEFSAPLYPTIASNTEATVQINFGQCPFSYGTANSHRTPNPCFIGPVVRSSTATAAVTGWFEDSRELFSMGRIDSQYLNSVVVNRGNSEENTSGRTTVSDSNRRRLEYDDESDADLFEIVLENSGRPTMTGARL